MKCEFQSTDGALEQFVLQMFDIAPFYCVINKCQTRTSDKSEKCVRSVAFCVQYVELYTEQRTFANSNNFLFSFEYYTIDAESYLLLREADGEHTPSQDTCERWFRCFKRCDFDTKQEEWQETWKITKNSKMWNCKHCWTKMIRKYKRQLGVSQQVVLNRLREMGKIQMSDRWVLYNLNDR